MNDDRRPRFRDVSPRVDFPALDARILAFWKEQRIFEKSLEGRDDAPGLRLLRGPAHGQRPPGRAPRHLAHLQGPLPALQDHARLPRAAQGRLGHARPAGGARGRAPPGHRRQGADRGLRRRRVQPAVPRERHRLPGGVGALHRAHRLLGRPRRRLLHVHQRVHRDGVVAAAADLGQGPALPGLQGRALLPALRHGHQQPRGGAGLQGRHRGLDLRALPADARGGRLALGGDGTARAGLAGRLDHHALDAHQQRRRRRAPRRRRTRSPRAAASASCWPRDLVEKVLGKEAVVERELPGRELLGLEYEPPFRFMHARQAGALRGRRRLRHHHRRHRHRPHRARLRRGRHARRASRTTCRSSTPSTPRAGSSPRSRRGPASSSRTPTRPSSPTSRPAACCSAWSPTSTAIPSAGAATRRCSTTPRRPGTSDHGDQGRSSSQANDDVTWHPEHIKHGRFGEWLANNVDWALSPRPLLGHAAAGLALRGGAHALRRQRRRAARAGGRTPLPDDLELHRPYVDDVVLALPRVRRRDAPRARGHRRLVRLGRHAVRAVALPVRERRRSSRERFPADFISEAIDQTRGWFYSLLAIATLVEGRSSYKRVLCLGHILDAEGQKMSKSKGNVVRARRHPRQPGRRRLPLVHVRRPAARGARGASAPRWSTRWCASSCSRCGTRTASSRVYANIDRFDPTAEPRAARRAAAARPLARRRAQHARRRRSPTASRTTTPPAPAAPSSSSSTTSATGTCAAAGGASGRARATATSWPPTTRSTSALVTVAKLLAPFTPFVAEELYQNLVRSVDADGAGERAPLRLAGRRRAGRSTPACRSTWRRRGASSSWAARRATPPRSRRASRWPRSWWRCPRPSARAVERLRDVVLDELNVKELRFVGDEGELVAYTVKPNLKVLGPKLGKQLGAAAGGAQRGRRRRAGRRLCARAAP